MRVALIYSGQERTWERCKQSHEDAIYTGDTVVFWHTVEALKVYPHFYQLDGHPYDQNRRPETVVASSLNQWHNNFIAFSLVPRDFDVYVRIRPDITFSGRIDFSQDYSGLKVYIPHGHNYWDGVNDQIAFGNWESMRRYYSVYLNHGDIFREGVEFHTERYVTQNLIRQGVEIIRIPVDNYIIR
jgi:hypothetical protein